MEHLDWQQLAKAVRARRLALGLSQRALSQHGGPSHLSVRNIERAAHTAYRGMTLSKLEQVLGWKPGTAQQILDGSAGSNPEAWVRADFTGASLRVRAVSKDCARRAAVDALLGYAEVLHSPEDRDELHAVLDLAKRLNRSPDRASA